MATHKVVLQVEVVMDDMDGNCEESAEIALDIVSDIIQREWDANANVFVYSYSDAPVAN